MFSIFGFAGQTIYNHLDARHTLRIEAVISSSNLALKASITANLEKPAFWQSLLSKKYSPMKILSDAEYESILQERLLRIEAEIALLDERIDQVKHEGQVGKDPALEQRRNGKQEDT